MAELMATMAVDLDVSDLDIDDRTHPGPARRPRRHRACLRAQGTRPPTPSPRSSTSTAAASSSAASTPSTRARRAWRRSSASSWCRSSTGSRPSTRSRPGSRTATPRCVWLHDQADALGVDPTRVAVNGGSAGGGLAAGLALLARDRGGPAICFQYLGIPELDDRLDTPSMQQFHDTPMWSRPQAEQSWEWYLGDAHGTDDVSPYAAPARATDLAGLPPAYMSTMEFDPLRDEGIIYALKLLAAGVSVELHSFPGTFHGSGDRHRRRGHPARRRRALHRAATRPRPRPRDRARHGRHAATAVRRAGRRRGAVRMVPVAVVVCRRRRRRRRARTGCSRRRRPSAHANVALADLDAVGDLAALADPHDGSCSRRRRTRSRRRRRACSRRASRRRARPTPAGRAACRRRRS